MPRFRVPIFIALAALLLSACAGGSDRRPPTKNRPQTVRPQMSDREFRQCLADLSAATVRYSPLPDRTFNGGCSAIQSVQLLDVGVPIANLGAMMCPLARTFAQWAHYGVLPAARRYLRTEVVKIETFGTYSCRNVNGASTGQLSQHAFANAVDVSAFILADGRRVAVKGGWRDGTADEREFLRTVHASACKRFKTVLGPEYNAVHHDHLHFDMGRGPFCR